MANMTEVLKVVEEMDNKVNQLVEKMPISYAMRQVCSEYGFSKGIYIALSNQREVYPSVDDGFVYNYHYEEELDKMSPNVVYVVAGSRDGIDELHYLASIGYGNPQFVQIEWKMRKSLPLNAVRMEIV